MDYNYKNFIIRINYGEDSGFDILKHVRGKDFILVNKKFHFTKVDEPLQRACNMVDKHEVKLIEKFKEDFTAFCKDVSLRFNVYAITGVDFRYFMKCHDKLEAQKAT